jgi:protein TonB
MLLTGWIRPLLWLLSGWLGVAPALAADAGPAPLRLSEREVLRQVTQRVEPEYPAMARQVRLAGAVDVEIVISEEGAVEETKVLSGNLLLSSSAVRAVRKWRFAPFESNGKAARVVTVLRFHFRM